ncbi:hypothetical protein ACFQZI_04420 [Mucilaginibacter lutimaris]|uniref:Uncharacterized protein n=1 Tax=Mucilaginibacter lutimaris TaxID=931629 RepID=A0ABW2ZD28_9SPHI
MKYILCLLIWLPGIAYCQTNISEQIILSKVAAMPEVKSFMKKARASQPQITIERTPEKDFKYYWVKVGLSNLGMYRTASNFYVDPEVYKIYYVDNMTGQGEQLLTLTQWRKWRKLSVWQKWHCYQHKNKKLTIYPCKP